MASILKRVFRIFNGTDWDTVHFETDSEQVKHDATTVKAKLDAFKSGALATVVNNLTTTAANTVLDGRQGKALNDKITAINSALATNTRTVTGIFVDLQIVRSGNVVWIRISSEAKKPMSRNQTYELFKLDIDLPIHSLYRRVQIDDSHGFFFRMATDGQITITPYATDISQGDGVNVSEVYLSN